MSWIDINKANNEILKNDPAWQAKVCKPVRTPLGVFKSSRDALMAHDKKHTDSYWLKVQCKKYPEEFHFIDQQGNPITVDQATKNR